MFYTSTTFNLCHHEEDFNIEVEGNFFATSHGKNSCDGIVLKRCAYKHSLQAIDSGFILNAIDFYEFVKRQCSNVKCIFVPSVKIHSTQKSLERRYAEAITLKGTKSFHKIIPEGKLKVKAYLISRDDNYTLADITNSSLDTNVLDSDSPDYLVGTYVSSV